MTALGIASIVFAGALCAGLLGSMLHAKLPEHHLRSGTTDVVKLVMGLIATASALVLGLLIASAQSSYKTQKDDIEKIAADIVEIDRLLAFYGPETQDARVLLREGVKSVDDAVWGTDSVRIGDLDPVRTRVQSNRFAVTVMSLTPKTDIQRMVIGQVVQLALNVAQLRLLLFEQVGGSISPPFVILLISWITVLFLGFGLLSDFNSTVIVTFAVGALSVSAAIFVILQLDAPYSGLIRLSDAPLREALAQMGQ